MTSNKSNSRGGRHHLDVMAKEEDDEWLFESIVAFLSSPIWSAPIQQFFEANCSLFSPEDAWSGGSLLEDDNEDIDMANVPIELIQVHLKYKDLVDTLINSFLQDIGVSYSQFTKACKNSSRLREHPVYLELFEQVWCAENFKLFKAQMVRKNVELELQALVLLQYQLGIIQSEKDLNAANGDEIMAIVMRKSKDEYDSLMRTRQLTTSPQHPTKSSGGTADIPLKKPQDLETAKKLVKSEKLVENLKQELHEQDKINRIIVQEELTEPVVKRPASARKTAPNDADLRLQLDRMKLEEARSKQGSTMATPRKAFRDDDDDVVGAASSAPPPPPPTNITQSILETNTNLDARELERRAEFMRKQRDLLNKKKNEERQKQLDAFMRESERSGEPRRPMSSRAARAVLSGADPVDLQQPISDSKAEEERKKLEARRALAETLKREVINNSGNNGASSSRKN